jgi:hypothetical protein
MKTKANKSKHQRKHFYKLLDSFDEKQFFAVKNFAEFVKEKNGDDELLQILLNAPYDENELSEQTIKDIEKSREEFKKGKTYSLSQIKKEIDI